MREEKEAWERRKDEGEKKRVRKKYRWKSGGKEERKGRDCGCREIGKGRREKQRREKMDKQGEEERRKEREEVEEGTEEEDEGLKEGLRICLGNIEGWGVEMRKAQKATEGLGGSLKKGMKKWIKDVIDAEKVWRGRVRREKKKRRVEREKKKAKERKLKERVAEMEKKVEEAGW